MLSISDNILNEINVFEEVSKYLPNNNVYSLCSNDISLYKCFGTLYIIVNAVIESYYNDIIHVSGYDTDGIFQELYINIKI